ncbi:FSR family fosmidomycin resistance protein-like MFS transporter [Streptacidiphilus sp. MAP12-33]|uniref:MFS transporter n=1 Tax=Streptacidiphilus sp. MAP12-33 TaxID=3156266 RepID=UPI003514BD44
MTSTLESTLPAVPVASPWRRMRVWGAAHAVDDLYQGLVPAAVPYFVLDRHYGYLAATGLTLAATLGSAVPQPFLGVAVDRFRLPWLAGVGVGLAGIGLGLAGLAGPYPAVWFLVLLSGLGVAMFHPAAGKAARADAGDSAAAMSVFAAGGSVGFFLAPVLATPALAAWGVGATVLFLPPAVLMAFVLLARARRARAVPGRTGVAVGTDRWGPFAVLTGVEVLRSVTFFGLSTFVELYWLRDLHASRALAGAALTCFLAGGVAGTLTGGRLADRWGMVRTIQCGTALVLPFLTALLLAPGAWAPLLFALLTGAALNVPFAVLVKLGQDYLPTRPGTAAGVTLGLAVSVGGLIAPVLGLIAEAHGPGGALLALCVVPPAALLLGLLLPEPGRQARGGCSEPQ